MTDSLHSSFTRHRRGSGDIFLSVCNGCGDRSERGEPHEMDDWEYKHAHTFRTGSGKGIARLTTSAKHYRTQSEDNRYTAHERKLWLQLAEEAERHVRDKSEQIPGQMELFD